MDKKIIIKNSLHHIVVYGYFQHAFELYLEKLKPEGVSDIEVAEMGWFFSNMKLKLRNGTIFSPNILNGSEGEKSMYPFTAKLSDQEKMFFYKIIKFPFKTIVNQTKKYYRNQKMKVPENLYSELYNNLRTEKAIEYLRKEFLKDLK